MIEKLFNLIAEGKTKEVIKLLLKIAKENGLTFLRRNVSIQSSRLNNIEKNKFLGLISDPDYNIEVTKINNSLLQIIQHLSIKKNNDTEEILYKKDEKKRKLIWRWVVVSLCVIIIILVGIMLLREDLVPPSNPEINLTKDTSEAISHPNIYSSLIVCVHGKRGKDDILLRGTGKLELKLKNRNTIIENIDNNGIAIFKEVPVEIDNETVEIFLLAKGYEIIDGIETYRINRASDTINIIIQKTLIPRPPFTLPNSVDTVFNKVQDTTGDTIEERPLAIVKCITKFCPFKVDSRVSKIILDNSTSNYDTIVEYKNNGFEWCLRKDIRYFTITLLSKNGDTINKLRNEKIPIKNGCPAF